jgi:enamine deaminase RidA (YjgF/YER057c/UK114 family)
LIYKDFSRLLFFVHNSLRVHQIHKIKTVFKVRSKSKIMSQLQYYAYKGQGEEKRVKFHYSQAVRVGDRIECAGQGKITPPSKNLLLTAITGGWDPSTGVFPKEINAQMDQAFANVELNLKDAGGKGWSQVFRVNSYHVPLNNEVLEAMVRNFKKWMPDHQPIWTCVGVSRLGEDDMRIEIEGSAYVGKEVK